MASGALERPVRSSKRKVRERMLEFGVVPELLTMAVAAVRKRTVMDVVLLVT